MASLALAFDILARDKASRPLRNVGNEADRTGRKFRDVGNEAERSGKKTSGFAGAFKKLGPNVAAGAAAVGAGVLAVGLSSLKMGSDLEQTRIKVGNVFGPKGTKLVEAFSKNAATSLGISRAAALEASATFGTFFTQLGFTQEQSAKTSSKVIKLAADLGSFNNLPTAEVLDSINSSLRGEFDSLQRLVPTINAAAVQQRALTDTGKKAASALTEQEKATATLALITEGSKLALNDFSESSKTLAIRQQVLKAKFDDARTALGTALLPAATAVAGFFTDKFVPAVERLVQQVRTGEGTGGKLRETFEKVKRTFEENRPALEQLGKMFLQVATFIGTKVIPIIVDLQATKLRLLVQAFNAVKTAVVAVGGTVLGFVKSLLSGIGSVFGVLAKVPGPFQDNFREAAKAVEGAALKVSGLQAGLRTLNGTTARPSIKLIGAGQAEEQILRLERRFTSIGGVKVRIPVGGDGPGAGGRMLSRVSKMIAGTGAAVSSTYRTPAQNKAVGGSPSSYHLDRGNPAVDVVGPASVLDRLAGQLRAQGGLRELLWRVPGHYDHLHVAHNGGTVSKSWPTLPGLRTDERPAILQTGERVLSRAEVAAGGQFVGTLVLDSGELIGTIRGVVRQEQTATGRSAVNYGRLG